MQLTASDPQYAFAPIMGGPPQRFAEGGTATADPKFVRDYRYSYDPANQSYALISQNQPPPMEESGLGPLARLAGMVRKNAPADLRYSYNPQDQSYALVSGSQNSAPADSSRFTAFGLNEGGLAAAQQTQDRGRGEDTMLVHMAPSEVKGLQALAMAHGGSLTINPQTGLPEAGFLKSLLPMLIGGALTVASGGALTPLMSAAIVGGGTALATGSLKKGLMAGLGAYGGAGLGAGLTAAGATTTGGIAATEAAKQAAGQEIAKKAAEEAALQGFTLPTDYSQLAASTATPAQVTAAQTMGQQAAMAGRGIEGLTTEAGRKAFMAAAPTGTLPTAGASIASALAPEPAKDGVKPISYYRPYEYNWNPNPEAYQPSPTPGDTSERRYFTPTYTAMPVQKMSDYLASQRTTTAAGGGLMDLAGGGRFTESPQEDQFDDERGVDGYAEGGYKRPKARSLEGDDYYKFAQSRRDSSMKAAVEQNFAAGGLGAARQALAPRFLSGGGDGMSDSIKANIDGKQEARLADGEFVVPADVVSHLGNGSSKAGAKKLYAMMDKIRQARTGKKKQAPAVNAARYMPA